MPIEAFLLPDAVRDLEEACAWYEASRVGLGVEFVRQVDDRIESLRGAPESHALVHRSFRRALVRRFPYAIFCEYNQATVLIYGILHTSRDPMKWRQRLP